jgi:GT2 family glycosyltransferase/glycosyltransferase involved in cell wall biosynthesis
VEAPSDPARTSPPRQWRAVIRSAVGSLLPRPLKLRLLGWERSMLRRLLQWQQRGLPRRLPPGPGFDVLVLPIIDWGFRFQRPQQLARELARRGHRVFYMSAAMIAGRRALVTRVAPGIAVTSLAGDPSFDLYRDRLAERVVRRALASLSRLRRDFRLDSVVCVVQFPSWRPLAEAARREWGWRIVYDCMDHHVGFQVEGGMVAAEEEALVGASDLVTVTSAALATRWAPSARRLIVLPNAADFPHFHEPAPVPPELRDVKRPIVGYYGAIAEWFDVELVAGAARARPGWSFVLVGSTVGADLGPLRGLANVRLLGERPYASLPGYLHAFDAALIPFRRTPLTEATNPVKLYEYLSSGKPVVAVELPELEPFGGLVYPMSGSAELVAQVEAALGEPPALREARVDAARRHTWASRVDELTAAVGAAHPRVAIVIVAFADAARLGPCLDALWAHTQHPNFVVVVVDNSGSAAVRELLLATAEREPRLRVLFNARNEGFPRANNQGIAAAGPCDYVVLLNDDTVVTHGWLARLLRHLDRPGVQLVGPVTNWAGNEARIEVPYETLEQMHAFADAYTRRHAGEARDIPMLALFCAAMRRDLLERIGPLDERFGVGMFEDDDFSRRVRQAGGRVVCAEDVFVHHWGRASFGALEDAAYRRLFEENRRKFEEKWGEPWRPHVARRETSARARIDSAIG